MNNFKIILAVGTRPEIIKMIPVYFGLKKIGLKPLLLHTGQHDDLAYPLYDFFGVKPDIDINLQRKPGKGNDLVALGILLMEKLSEIFTDMKPDLVLVHGDTLSAYIASWVAFCHKIRIGHVEAGLRSHDKYTPFPEEMNRTLIGPLADFHFAPTKGSKDNLLREGVKKSHIYVVGNTIVDSARMVLKKTNQKSIEIDTLFSKTPITVNNSHKKLILVTAHRRENQPTIKNIIRAVGELIQYDKELTFLWPVHPNPKIKAAIHKVYSRLDKSISSRLILTHPLNYPKLMWVMKNSWLILTDSGGIQEEAAAIGKPLLILRDNTERPEIIKSGEGILVGTNKNRIIKEVKLLLKDKTKYKKMSNAKNPFGDGTSGSKISSIILRELKKGND